MEYASRADVKLAPGGIEVAEGVIWGLGLWRRVSQLLYIFIVLGCLGSQFMENFGNDLGDVQTTL